MKLSRLFARPGERILAMAILCVSLVIATITSVRHAPIDWSGYALQTALVLMVGLVGAAYRFSGRDERLASAALSTALLLQFTSVLATYNYLLLPNSGFSLDPWLARSDALIGYRWSDWVEWSVGYPHLAKLLGWIYASTLAQIAVLILTLAGTRLWTVLDRMQVTLVFAAIATVVFWGAFPSISISAFQPISAEAARIVAPMVGPDVGSMLLHLLRHGPDRISPDEMTGVIGFPSFHTVLALLCTRFAWPVRALRYPFLVINLAMVPAILLHGSHYVLDLFGGLLFFLGASAAARRTVAALDATSGSTRVEMALASNR